jgi:hypothetical protein
MRTVSGLFAGAIALGFSLSAVAQNTPKHPDFQGIWNSSSGTPMERPLELKAQEFFTAEQAAAWRATMVARSKRDGGFVQTNVGTYNDAFWEIGTEPDRTMRTSMVFDPPDGRIPALTAAASAEMSRRVALTRHPGRAQDLAVQDRCLSFPTDAPPMIPYNYNSNYTIVQTSDYIAITPEMVHDTRVIPLDGRAHVSPRVRLWLGDSVGHWEGETLVVDTTNFSDAAGWYGSDRNLHVVERFRRVNGDRILYRFDVEDPTAFVKPWKGELSLNGAAGPVYEYACHEGNYALVDLLKGAATERAGK